jgi:hypothetical protein
MAATGLVQAAAMGSRSGTRQTSTGMHGTPHVSYMLAALDMMLTTDTRRASAPAAAASQAGPGAHPRQALEEPQPALYQQEQAAVSSMCGLCSSSGTQQADRQQQQE